MDKDKAIELLNKALGCVQTDPRNCGKCKECENYATKEDGIEAIRMATAALEQAPAIPIDWIRAYISNLKTMGVQLSLRDAQAVSVMVDKYMMEQNGNATCGPDYCEIGGEHND